jgi:hypothetical protein
MSFQHPSLEKPKPRKPRKRPFSEAGPELILKALTRDPKLPEKYKRKWKEGNEERMLKALERFGHLQLRVKFEILEEDGNGYVKYKTLAGRTLVFKRIETQGSLLGIVEALVDAGVGEAKRWTDRRKGGSDVSGIGEAREGGSGGALFPSGRDGDDAGSNKSVGGSEERSGLE